MGRFVYTMNTSVDLVIEQVPGDHGAGAWLRIDEELHEDFNALARECSMFIHGRVFYEIMEKSWPDAAADASLPPVVHDYGRIWVSKPKVLVSSSRDSAGYNTRIVGGEDAIGQLAQIRSEINGPIAVGGSNIATQLLAAGLLDELVLYGHPSILGFGRSLFQDYDRPVDLELKEQKRFASGVTLHRYTILQTI